MLHEDFKSISRLNVPKNQGVYVIKEKSNRLFKNKIFYVGKSTNLFNRIIKQHSSNKNKIAGSILRIKLNRKGLKYSEIVDYLNKECLFIIQDIRDYDITTLVEDLLIAVLRKRGEPLINEVKSK